MPRSNKDSLFFVACNCYKPSTLLFSNDRVQRVRPDLCRLRYHEKYYEVGERFQVGHSPGASSRNPLDFTPLCPSSVSCHHDHAKRRYGCVVDAPCSCRSRRWGSGVLLGAAGCVLPLSRRIGFGHASVPSKQHARLRTAQHATMAVVFQHAVRKEYMADSSD
jgi:hypothetical protein